MHICMQNSSANVYVECICKFSCRISLYLRAAYTAFTEYVRAVAHRAAQEKQDITRAHRQVANGRPNVCSACPGEQVSLSVWTLCAPRVCRPNQLALCSPI